MARLIAELPNDAEMRNAFRENDRETIALRLRRLIPMDVGASQVVALPAFAVGPLMISASAGEPPERGVERPPEEAIREALRGLVAVIEVRRERVPEYIAEMRKAGMRTGGQAVLAPFDHWVPNGDRPPLFHTRPAAEALIHADAPRDGNLLGQGVNLVLFDEGMGIAALHARAARPVNYIGGWVVQYPGDPPHLPGMAAPDGHGTMVALNAVSLAPRARLFDLPVRPPRINRVAEFASFAAAALARVEAEIRLWLRAAFPGPWVFCHPWGIYDRRLEVPRGGYTGDSEHILNWWIRFLATDSGHDQVFAAGNGGQFAPHPRCGPGDIGPGESILGANSSPHVLTVGAVRADGTWIGYSSQGPGQPGFAEPAGSLVEKPDLCAPSHFCETTDGAWLSSGTSAACGMASGAVAALRSQGAPLRALSTVALRRHLRDTAWKPDAMAQVPYDLRFGHGILDLDAALGTSPAATGAPVTDEQAGPDDAAPAA